MKSIKFAFTLSLLIIFLTNCDSENLDVESGFNQKILFETGYANFAWFPTHAGFLIDSAGAVYCYNLPKDWKGVDSLGQISEEDMEFNLRQTDSICFTIDKADLQSRLSLLAKASLGFVTERVNQMNDAGGSSDLGYTFNTETRKYTQVILEERGDWSRKNTSKSAEELVNWLTSITLEIRERHNQQ